MTNTAIEDPRAWLRNFEERANRMREQSEAAQASLAENKVTLSSPDSMVTVTVTGTGVMESLELGARAATTTPVRLTQVIMETYQQACARAAARTTEIMAELVGPDSEAMDLMREAIPSAEADSAPVPTNF